MSLSNYSIFAHQIPEYSSEDKILLSNIGNKLRLIGAANLLFLLMIFIFIVIISNKSVKDAVYIIIIILLAIISGLTIYLTKKIEKNIILLDKIIYKTFDYKYFKTIIRSNKPFKLKVITYTQYQRNYSYELV